MQPIAGTRVAGYSDTPLATKLGVRTGSKVVLIGAPDGYRESLAPLPRDVRFASKITRTADIVQVFTTQKAELQSTLAVCRKTLKPTAAVWISWPKKSAKVPSQVTEDIVREIALPLGFVDVKVCAVDTVWSGLKLVVRKELR
jgi:hypothetical protein